MGDGDNYPLPVSYTIGLHYRIGWENGQNVLHEPDDTWYSSYSALPSEIAVSTLGGAIPQVKARIDKAPDDPNKYFWNFPSTFAGSDYPSYIHILDNNNVLIYRESLHPVGGNGVPGYPTPNLCIAGLGFSVLIQQSEGQPFQLTEHGGYLVINHLAGRSEISQGYTINVYDRDDSQIGSFSTSAADYLYQQRLVQKELKAGIASGDGPFRAELVIGGDVALIGGAGGVDPANDEFFSFFNLI